MSRRDTAPVGAPCWVDLTTSDQGKARAFYSGLFGWTADEPDPAFGGYFNFRKDGLWIAGCMSRMPDQPGPDQWSVHLATDDAAKTVDAAASNGGQVIVPPMPVGELGTMSVVLDPGGAAVGAWQPGTHRGCGFLYEPGAPSWFELHTRDHDTAVRFYRNVFRWDTRTVSDTDEFRYTVLAHGDEQLAGILHATEMPAGEPAHWYVYFGVADADAALARAVELGGSVVEPAADTPYGRLATAADPTGARFKLVAGGS